MLSLRRLVINSLPLLFLFIGIASSQGHNCEDDYQPDPVRVDCPGADHDTDENICRTVLNCTWCPTVPDTPIPWCYVSSPTGSGYVISGEPINSPDGVTINLQLSSAARQSPRFENEFEALKLTAEFQSDSRLRIKIAPNTPDRFEVPLEILPSSETNQNPLYSFEYGSDPLFSFKVLRKSDNAVLFDTAGFESLFVFAEQYISLKWKLPSENVYGIGENEQHSFKHNFRDNKKYPLWARDNVPDSTVNIYGVQPHYTVLENGTGNAHAVALVNSNAQEWSMLEGPVVEYRTIGGVLDFYFFLGPTPENTVQQYTEAVGRAPMPPYWGLGFQLCRFGYDSLANMKAAVDRTRQYDIPHDVQYGDIDIMDRRLDFTYDRVNFAGLPDYIRELKEEGIKFVTILDPCISIGEPAGSYPPFDRGNEMDVWVKRANGSPAQGRVWPPDDVYFPDYSKNSTRTWWIDFIVEFHDLLEYDGLWIDMNEPANFVDGDVQGCDTSNKFNSPPYVPAVIGGSLWSFTVCADSQQAAGVHYNVHSLYGWFESEPTLVGATLGTGKRTLVLSRSTFLGSGRWTAHWLGDNFSTWENMYYSIIGMLQYNLFGIPMVGADICGFNWESTAELCQRWQQVGAFYPFSRNHNTAGQREQDPGFFGPAVAASTRSALMIRYTLLPYLYTLFHHAYTRGDTVARALWHEFPTDPVASGIDRQFLWGSGLLVSPVLNEGATSVEAYFPNSRFYSYHDGREVNVRGEFQTLSAPLDFIPLHIHGGSILPTQEPARNTQLARENPLGLIIALDDSGSASGDLYYDDGDVIDPHSKGLYFLAKYTYTSRTLSMSIEHDGYTGMSEKQLDTVRILGEDVGATTRVFFNGREWLDFSVNPEIKEVLVRNLRVQANTAFTILLQ